MRDDIYWLGLITVITGRRSRRCYRAFDEQTSFAKDLAHFGQRPINPGQAQFQELMI
jgi:hypothetical protein